MNSAFRKNLVSFHTWSGLTIGLIVTFLAVTGAAFVLKPRLQGIVYGNLSSSQACHRRLTLDALAADARAVHPSGVLYSIEIRAGASSSTAIKFSDKDLVYLDPCNGRILGVQNEYGGFFGEFDALHRFRFMKDGRQFAGTANAVFLTLLLLGGFVLWWPRAGGSFKEAAKFNPRLPGTARTISLHKTVGLYALLALSIVSITGVPIAFQPVKNAIGWAVGSPMTLPPPPQSRVPTLQKRKSMQDFWALAQGVFPDAQWISLRYPARPTDPIAIEALERGAPHAEAKSYLYLDAYTGRALRVLPYATAVPRGRKIYLFLLALHSGLVGGLPYQLLLLAACLAVPVLTYSGFSPYLRRKLRKPVAKTIALTVVRRQVEATAVCTFELARPNGRRLPPFSAGSHIDVQVRPGIVRQYSLCNAPAETHRYLIGVLRAPVSRGGSSGMHDEIREGTRLVVGAPRNHFVLREDASRSLLLAGGIGVTPIISMAERLSAIGADFEMHYCTRSPERTAFLHRIQTSRFARRVHFYFDDGPDRERLDLQALLTNSGPGIHLYACGPKGFMDTVIETALRNGWQDANIHREYFNGAGQSSAANLPFDIKIASTGRIVRVERDETALAALRKAGIAVQSSCSHGVCGTCMTRVLEGVPDHRDVFLTTEERAKGDRILPCCSRSTGAMLVLDL
ncbi:MAG TPA: PepSY domain-containing protein [Steroidobacteraceae bacterium]|nr:PepSY domain-containing protein [Steroidobacteraceae bacterium]